MCILCQIAGASGGGLSGTKAVGFHGALTGSGLTKYPGAAMSGGANTAPVSTLTVAKTGKQDIDGLLAGIKWGSTSLTYSFPTSAAYYGYSGEANSTFQPFTETQKAAVRKVLAAISAVTNLNFSEVAETTSVEGHLRFGSTNYVSTAWAYYPSTAEQGGDAWFNYSNGYYTSPSRGNYAYFTFLHEIGHALGLKHGHDTNGYGALPSAHNSMEYSVMTYASYVGATIGNYTNESNSYAQSLMQDDIAALQAMYGADYTTNSSNTTYKWSPTTGEKFINGVGQGAPTGNRIFETVWDGGGIDTYDFSNYTTNLKVNLNPGSWTTVSDSQRALLHWDGSKLAVGNIANALLYNNNTRSMIENATGGSGSDTIIGNGLANTLSGNSGNDTIQGGSGNDRLVGGWGADVLTGGAGYDKFVFSSLGQKGDRITDFASGTDKLEFASAVFSNLIAKGTLSTSRFDGNGVATKTVAELIYNPTTKILYYDPDGTGSQTAIALATLTNVTKLLASDILIV